MTNPVSAKMVAIEINGKPVEVREGSTIIEAYYQNKEEIAHYCWHPGLSIAGVCRLCMVEIEGNPRLQIACNTTVTPGMKVNNKSAKVKDAVKWGLDFHLINHPLDCPICDQAGECGLQDQYMKYGQYVPEMAERKVKKHKVVDLGPRVVLDSERCILCSRCVRFTEEVSKTCELGIFNRGDHAEVGTFAGKPLNNKYSANVVDICPVGALTSKDFRFQQRVWFLKEKESVCTGCSTGCNIKVYYNREGVFRVKPKYNAEVNGHWMCDEGRDVYKYVNRENRFLDGKVSQAGKVEFMQPAEAAKRALDLMKKTGPATALVLTGSYTNEEFDEIVSSFKSATGSAHVYHWINNSETIDQFDGLLLRGDRNPNTKGLLAALTKSGFNSSWSSLVSGLESGAIKTLVVAAPENPAQFPDLKAKVKEFSHVENLVWLGSAKVKEVDDLTGSTIVVPLKTSFEKQGSFTNFSGKIQAVEPVVSIVPSALSLNEVAQLLRGESIQAGKSAKATVGQGRTYNEFTLTRGAW